MCDKYKDNSVGSQDIWNQFQRQFGG